MTKKELLDKLKGIHGRLNKEYDDILGNGCTCNCQDSHESLNVIHNVFCDLQDIVYNAPEE